MRCGRAIQKRGTRARAVSRCAAPHPDRGVRQGERSAPLSGRSALFVLHDIAYGGVDVSGAAERSIFHYFAGWRLLPSKVEPTTQRLSHCQMLCTLLKVWKPASITVCGRLLIQRCERIVARVGRVDCNTRLFVLRLTLAPVRRTDDCFYGSGNR